MTARTAQASPAAKALLAAAEKVRGVTGAEVGKWNTVTVTFTNGATLVLRPSAVEATPVRVDGRVVGQLDWAAKVFRPVVGPARRVLGPLDALTMLVRQYV